jgi:hypothetical protein
MTVLAVFGITDPRLNLAVSLFLLFLTVLWLALIFWTFADAKRRIADRMLIACATLASFFPFIGTIVYMIVRPPEYLDDVRERELEMAGAEARLQQLEGMTCPYCEFDIEKSFLRCPSCLRRLKEPCTTCGKPLDPRWKIGPYCESEIAGATLGRHRPPGRRPVTADAASVPRSAPPSAASPAAPGPRAQA